MDVKKVKKLKNQKKDIFLNSLPKSVPPNKNAPKKITLRTLLKSSRRGAVITPEVTPSAHTCFVLKIKELKKTAPAIFF